MFKEIFSQLIAVIFRPSETWESLRRKEENTETFLSRFVYPLFGLIALSAFLGVLFTRKEFDFQIALKSSIKILVASMGGFFLGTHLLNELWYKVFKYPRDIKLIQRFVGYSSSLMFVLLILLALLPEFIFLWMFILLYRVDGSTPLYESERRRTNEIYNTGFGHHCWNTISN